MVNYFNDFANLCFERFGNRVKYWITFNNPWVCSQLRLTPTCPVWKQCNRICSSAQSVAVEGYETGEHAPGLKLRGTGAYRAAHHIIKVGEDKRSSRVKRGWPPELNMWRSDFTRHTLRSGTATICSGGANRKVRQDKAAGVTCSSAFIGVDR